MEGRARGDVNVIDGGIEERETHILEGDVTESRAGRRCNGRCCYTRPLAFSAILHATGAWPGAYVWILF